MYSTTAPWISSKLLAAAVRASVFVECQIYMIGCKQGFYACSRQGVETMLTVHGYVSIAHVHTAACQFFQQHPD
jgi:hypothetical protein